MDTGTKVEALREYVLDYVTGTLWLLALGGWYVATGQTDVVRDSIRDVGAALPSGAGSEFFVAFLLLIGGVIVPYSVAMAFRPITWILMNFVLRVHVFVIKRIIKRDPVENELHRKSAETLKALLSIRGEPTQDMMRLYINSTDAEIGRQVQKAHEHVRFQSLSLLPASLFIGFLTQHLVGASPGVWAAVAFLIVFVIGARSSNKALFILGNTIEMAVLLAAKRRGDATTGITPPSELK